MASQASMTLFGSRLQASPALGGVLAYNRSLPLSGFNSRLLHVRAVYEGSAIGEHHRFPIFRHMAGLSGGGFLDL